MVHKNEKIFTSLTFYKTKKIMSNNIMIKLFNNCREFSRLRLSKLNKKSDGKINRDFIRRMVADEMQELLVARDVAEEIDAILDACYYMLEHVATAGKEYMYLLKQYDMTINKHIINFDKNKIAETINGMLDVKICNTETLINAASYCIMLIYSHGWNPLPIWDLIHTANMTKFGPGGYQNELGKWEKPANFVKPDDKIRLEVIKQLAHKK